MQTHFIYICSVNMYICMCLVIYIRLQIFAKIKIIYLWRFESFTTANFIYTSNYICIHTYVHIYIYKYAKTESAENSVKLWNYFRLLVKKMPVLTNIYTYTNKSTHTSMHALLSAVKICMCVYTRQSFCRHKCQTKHFKQQTIPTTTSMLLNNRKIAQTSHGLDIKCCWQFLH